MKAIIKRFFILALVAGTATTRAQGFQGPWILRIENLEHKEISSLTIRFTDRTAPSCIGGDWKRIVIEKSKTTDKNFFPVSEPLSYQIAGKEVTIGRNEVCDGYLHLRGALKAGVAQGTYRGFGMAGGNQLGYFSLKQDH